MKWNNPISAFVSRPLRKYNSFREKKYTAPPTRRQSSANNCNYVFSGHYYCCHRNRRHLSAASLGWAVKHAVVHIGHNSRKMGQNLTTKIETRKSIIFTVQHHLLRWLPFERASFTRRRAWPSDRENRLRWIYYMAMLHSMTMYVSALAGEQAASRKKRRW